MRIHRFFIKQQVGTNKKLKIEDMDLVHQWRKVLRFQVGQEMILFDNTGWEFRAVLSSFVGKIAEVQIVSSRRGEDQKIFPVFLYVALAKREAFEWVLEKGTELGITGFVPLVTERSEKKNLNRERSEKILKEASEQSGRVFLPEIYEPIEISKAISGLGLPGMTMALDPRGATFDAREYRRGERVNVFIGPEGGFTEKEIALFKEHNIPVVSLGKQILRFETASIAIGSILILGS